MTEATVRKKVVLIFPCYNEEESISELLQLAKKLQVDGFEFSCLPVNDFSTDHTLRKISAVSAHYLHLANNLGIGGAVQSGLKYALVNGFDYAIQVDGDGQHPVNEIPKLITGIVETKSDVCIGSRYITQKGFQSTLARRTGIGIINRLIKLITGKRIYDSTSGFRIFNARAIELFSDYYPDKYPEPESIVYGMINGLVIHEVPVIMSERQGGQSSISGYRTIYYMVKVTLAIIFLKISSITFKKN